MTQIGKALVKAKKLLMDALNHIGELEEIANQMQIEILSLRSRNEQLEASLGCEEERVKFLSQPQNRVAIVTIKDGAEYMTWTGPSVDLHVFDLDGDEPDEWLDDGREILWKETTVCPKCNAMAIEDDSGTLGWCAVCEKLFEVKE